MQKEDVRKEATRNMNKILEVQRKFNKIYVGWPETEDIYTYQMILSNIIEISEYLGEKDSDDIKRCKEILSVIKRLHNFAMDKKYVLYKEITDLVRVLHKDMKHVIEVLVKKCTANLCKLS